MWRIARACHYVSGWQLLLPAEATMQVVFKRHVQHRRFHRVQKLSPSLHHAYSRCHFCIRYVYVYAMPNTCVA
jgi:hypothetical protein